MEGEDEDAALCGGTGSGGSGCKYLPGENVKGRELYWKRENFGSFDQVVKCQESRVRVGDIFYFICNSLLAG